MLYNQYMEHYEGKNKENARKMRRGRNATRQEGILWHVFLKHNETNFARQYRIGNYILDFYAPSIKLAIEIDGGQHYEDEALRYDQARTAFLQEHDIEVLRFTNTDIDKNLYAVMDAIRRGIEKRKIN